MKHSKHMLPLLALFVIGLNVRLIPLTFSNLSYNIDGFPLVRLTQDIIDNGHWTMSYPEGTSNALIYNSKMPIFSLIMAEFSLMLGITPMEVMPFALAIIASTAIITTYMLAYLITKNRVIAFFAGLALALNGLYVYFGCAIMKETIGLVLLPIILYLFAHREDPRKRVLAALLLLMLPLIHHLTTWIAFTMITLLAVTSNSVKWHKGTFHLRELILDFVLGPMLFVFAVIYYNQVDMVFFKRISNTNDIMLFLSVLLVGTLFGMSYSKPRKKHIKTPIFSKLILIPIAGILALVLNHYKRLFTGAMQTNTIFLVYFIPYVVFAMIGFIGVNIVGTRKNRYRPLVASIFLGTLTVMIFAVLKGLDAFTYNLVYRSYDFMDVGLAICIGVGVGYLINSIVRNRYLGKIKFISTWQFKAIMGIFFIILCLLTLPLAYNNERFHNVQDVTHEYEFEAMIWLDENVDAGTVNTNQRIADILNPYFDTECDSLLPWKLRDREKIDSGSVLFMEDKWTSKGAQMYPMEPTIISNRTFQDILNSNNLIYSGGSGENKVYIIITD